MKNSKLQCLAAAGALFLMSIAGCSNALEKNEKRLEGEFEIVVDPAVGDFVKVLQTRANQGELVMLFVTGGNDKMFRVINKTSEAAITHSSTGNKGADAATLNQLGLGAGIVAMPFVFKMPKSDVRVKSMAGDVSNTPEEPGVVGSPSDDPKNGAGKSMNNSLVNLSVDGIDFYFQSSITNYNLISASSAVIADQTNVTVTAAASNPNAVISINGASPAQWIAKEIVPLNGPGSATTISVKVTAGDAVTTAVYTVTVYRNAREPEIPPGGPTTGGTDPNDPEESIADGKNANLKWLEPLDKNKKAVSNVIVWPRVHAKMEMYELFTNDLNTRFDMRVYTADPQATVTITDAQGSPYPITNTQGSIFTLPQLAADSSAVVDGLTHGKGAIHNAFITKSKKVPLRVPVKITITSRDGSTVKTYTITQYSYIGNGEGVPQARGGHIKFIKEGSMTHEIHTFWDNKYHASDIKDTFAFITKNKPVDKMWVLVQGGGGKGGQWTSKYYGVRVHMNGGGGGAGDVIEERAFSIGKDTWSYPVVAGRGGLNDFKQYSEDGQPSSFGSLQAVGGGGGWHGMTGTSSGLYWDAAQPPRSGGPGEDSGHSFGAGGGGAKTTSGTSTGKDRDGKNLYIRDKLNWGGAGETSDISGSTVIYGAGGHGGGGYLDSYGWLYDGCGGNLDTINWDYTEKDKKKEHGSTADYDYNSGIRRNGGPGRVIVRFTQDWDRALGR